MDSILKAVKLTETVYWVGAVDWNVRNFHGYTTSKGTTYNAFLILSDKITLVDTVKKPFYREMLCRISSIINPEDIDVIISNHAEPDHSGCLKEMIELAKPSKVYASKMGVKALDEHFGLGESLEAVSDGQEVSLGNKTVKFFETRMLHWPDSMFSYIEEDGVLFTQDAFGMHLAGTERFDDELDWDTLKKNAESYFANIITLYAPHVLRILKKVTELNLDIKMLAPDHGPVWRDKSNFPKLFDLYTKWSSRNTDKKAVIVYDSMWGATEKMARFIEDGIMSSGVKVKTISMSSAERSQVADELLDASALLIGASTLNNNLLPSMADVLTYVKGLKFNTPYLGVFGSYGWSGESLKQLKDYAEAFGGEIVGEVRSKYTPDDSVLKESFELGRLIADKILEK